LNETRFPRFLEVDLEESLAVRVDRLARVAAKVLQVQRCDDEVTAGSVSDDLEAKSHVG
jgi:hypothetical protein